MTVSFRISDYSPNVNITEAGIDYFYVTNSSVLGISESNDWLQVYPNPSNSELTIESKENAEYSFSDLNGKVLIAGLTSQKHTKIDLTGLETGTYLLRLGSQTKRVIKE